MVQIANSSVEATVNLVVDYNGTINEIISYDLLFIFCAPQEMPDRAQRGIACAIEMQNALVAVNAEQRRLKLPQLAMGIGINTGEGGLVEKSIAIPEAVTKGVVGGLGQMLGGKKQKDPKAMQPAPAEQPVELVGEAVGSLPCPVWLKVRA